MLNDPNLPLFEVVEIDRRQFLRIAGGALISLSALSLIGCGGGGGSSSAGGSLKSMTGKVSLTAKAAAAAGKLAATNVSGQGSVSSSGSFTISVPSAGPSLVVVTNAAGVGIVMGFVDPAKGPATLSYQSTAAALLYFAFGCPKLPSDAKGVVVDYLLSHSAVTTCAQVMSTRMDISVTAISDGDATIAAALKTAFLAVRGSSQAGKSDTVKTLKPADLTAILINPSGQQSGIEVDQGTAPATVNAINRFHVPARLYVYKTGTADESATPVTTLLPKAQLMGQPIDIKGTTQLGGLQGAVTLIGLLTGLANGGSPYTPIISAPISVPIDAGKSKSLYSLISVSASNASTVPSFFSDPIFLDEIPAWQKEHEFLCVYTFLMDICLGVFFDMLGVSDLVSDTASVSTAYTALANIEDTAWQEIITSVKFGAFGPGLKSAVLAVSSNGYISQQVRIALAPLVGLVSQRTQFLTQGAAKIALSATAKLLLSAADLLVGFGNLSATLLDLNNSDYADRFDISVIRPLIHLTPTSVTVVAGHTQTFKVTPPTGVTGKVVYDWSFTGPSDAYITDEEQGRGASFESSATTIFLITSQIDQGSAGLKVEAFLVGANNVKTSIGIATAAITFTKQVATEPGTFDVVTFPEDTGRKGVIAVVRFTPIPGATYYSVEGTGGNDTEAYGTHIDVGVANGNWPTEYDGTPIPNCVGLSQFNGGVGSDFAGEMHSRFDGFTFVVTPSY